jgi:hypothetical protein
VTVRRSVRPRSLVDCEPPRQRRLFHCGLAGWDRSSREMDYVIGVRLASSGFEGPAVPIRNVAPLDPALAHGRAARYRGVSATRCGASSRHAEPTVGTTGGAGPSGEQPRGGAHSHSPNGTAAVS